MDKMSIYNRLPVWGQNLACFYEGSRIKHTRYGKDFWRYLAEYESRADWSYDQICDFRDARLRKMIHHCYDTVPYYTKLFNDGGINPDSIKTLNDLRVLPILTKDQVKANIADFRSTLTPHKETKIHATGGTTGAGLNFLTTNSEEAEQWAVWWRYRRKHGIEIDTWCGNFGGKLIQPLSSTKPPYWRTNTLGKQVFYSGYHINKETAKLYADSIKKSGIAWIHGYPSNISNLAAYLNSQGIVLPLKWVSIGAENLYRNQICQIESAFGVKPFQHYGLTEGVANISEQPDGELIVDEDFAAVEFIESDLDSKRIVGTTLANFTMPLIRYDTGDFALVENESANRCGRVVKSLQGRSNECVVLPNGIKVGAAAISLILNKFSEIQCTQIVQKKLSSIVVNIMCADEARYFPIDALIKALRERFGQEIEITICFVKTVDRTKSGKYKLIVSELE